jgi:hypothetical protein
MKPMRRVRRITSGVLGALLFQLGAGSSLLPCVSHGSVAERAGSHTSLAGSGPREDHEGMPCDQMEPSPGGSSTVPPSGDDCSFPSGGPADCGMLLSCMSLLAEPSAVRSASDALNPLQVAALTPQSPRTVFSGPDHPPPRV